MSRECEGGTGWLYCDHAADKLTVCRCSCTCRNQRHCPFRGTSVEHRGDRETAGQRGLAEGSSAVSHLFGTVEA